VASGLAVSDVLPNTAPDVTNHIAEECCDHGNDCGMLITALTDDIIVVYVRLQGGMTQ